LQITILETSTAGLLGTARRMGGRGISVIMPATDLGQAVNAARRMISLAGTGFEMVIVYDNVRQGFVKSLNQAATATGAEFVAYVAQDALAGSDWLKAAHEKISAENKSVCAFNDGIFNGGLAQFGLVRTAFTSAHYGEGNVFFPGYHTHRADEDLSHLAHVHGQYTYAPNAILLEIEFRLKRTVNSADVELYARRKPVIYGARPDSA
jgi:hypothetical protein